MNGKIAFLAICFAFCWQLSEAQSLLPIVKNSNGKSNVGSVSTASYTVGAAMTPTQNVESTQPTTHKVAPATAKTPAKVSIPRLNREMPAAKEARGYLTSIRTNVHFHLNRTDLDLAYLDNKETLDEFMDAVDSLGANNLLSVEIVSKASPEGTIAKNDSLAKGRCQTIINYISNEYPALASIISGHPDGESWDELRSYVQKDINLSSSTRSAIFRIIDGERDLDKREAALKKIGSSLEVGDIYNYLYYNYFPLIRNTGIYIVKK